MKPKTFMLIAGEPSGDVLGAELVLALRRQFRTADNAYTLEQQPLRTGLEPRFFGAGGPHMANAGADIAVDMTRHSVIGIWDVLRQYRKFRRLFHELLNLARHREPDAIIGIDYGGFNLRFAHAIRRETRRRQGTFRNWNPGIIQFVSPQVWASRPRRALQMAEDHDLLLSIFPFEKKWYAQRAPGLRVEYVGHPMVERFSSFQDHPDKSRVGPTPLVLLLPGSRTGEIERHLPVMNAAIDILRQHFPNLRTAAVVPSESLASLARAANPQLEVQVGNLPKKLRESDLAIASTGTVTMECAFCGVPAVTLYRTSAITYQLGKRLVTVKWLTMPNILAGEEIYPEFVQHAATPANVARAALELLRDEPRRTRIQTKLQMIVSSLGGPGASQRAAKAIHDLFP